MELGLSLGQTPKTCMIMKNLKKIDFRCSTALSIGLVGGDQIREPEEGTHQWKKRHSQESQDINQDAGGLSPKSNHQLPLQLNLLPRTLVLHHSNNLPSHLAFQRSNSSDEKGELFPSMLHAGSSAEAGVSKRLQVNRVQKEDDQEEGEEAPAVSSSPNNSADSSFQINMCIYSKGLNRYGKRESDGEGCDQRASSRASDEDDNNSGNRKKLRLSKEQSAFLEDSFKEHSTLNPKQKLALAKQLGLRPRQVEVWFQNRRARTKLKQTEIDCEYMKRYCETLSEENRRLNKELQELRALKTSNPFHMQLPATTLTMCPSCERVGSNSTSAISKTPSFTIHTNGVINASSKANDPNHNTSINGFPLTRPKFYPFAPI